MNPYTEPVEWIRKNTGTGSANGLAKLILSLYNPRVAYSFRECSESFNEERKDWAIEIIKYFLEHGEDRHLQAAGEVVSGLCPTILGVGLERSYGS